FVVSIKPLILLQRRVEGKCGHARDQCKKLVNGASLMAGNKKVGSRPQKEQKSEPMAAAANTFNAMSARDALAGAGIELETLFRPPQTLVMRSAYRITGSMNDAEDVLQTVFLRLAGRDFDAAMVGNIEGYLHRAAVNAALDQVRARQEGRKQALED